MATRKYHCSASTFDTQAHIDELNREISDHLKQCPLTREADREKLMSKLLRRAGALALHGISRGEGGPFAAMLVDFGSADGVPRVVGFGTNHVIPNSDPTAHAEITAIRDACARLKQTDLTGLTLVTSCECCPMCLSAATGCRIEHIYFAATRDDAAKAGFSDAGQYHLMASGGIEKHARRAVPADQAQQRLANHDAVVEVRYQGKRHAYYGDYSHADPLDPTALPVIQAIRNACRALAELCSHDMGGEQKVFHLPEDTVLISRHAPHPLSLIAADWARIGRARGADPDDPLQDAPQKKIEQILYLNDQPEPMPLRCGQQSVEGVPAQQVWQQIRQPCSVHLPRNLGKARWSAFKKWQVLVGSKDVPKY